MIAIVIVIVIDENEKLHAMLVAEVQKRISAFIFTCT